MRLTQIERMVLRAVEEIEANQISATRMDSSSNMIQIQKAINEDNFVEKVIELFIESIERELEFYEA